MDVSSLFLTAFQFYNHNSHGAFEFILIFGAFNYFLVFSEMLYDYFSNIKRDWKDTWTSFLVNLIQILKYLVLGFFFISLFPFYPENSFNIPITWWSWIIALLLTDFVTYVLHFLQHKYRIFWGEHKLHHNSNSFNFMNAYRLSWIREIFLFLVNYSSCFNWFLSCSSYYVYDFYD